MIKPALSLFLFIGLCLPSIANSQALLQKVVVTYSSRSIASIDLFVAQERGFFREEGLEAQLVQVRANAAIAAIVSGKFTRLAPSAVRFARFHAARRSKSSR